MSKFKFFRLLEASPKWAPFACILWCLLCFSEWSSVSEGRPHISMSHKARLIIGDPKLLGDWFVSEEQRKKKKKNHLMETFTCDSYFQNYKSRWPGLSMSYSIIIIFLICRFTPCHRRHHFREWVSCFSHSDSWFWTAHASVAGIGFHSAHYPLSFSLLILTLTPPPTPFPEALGLAPTL